MKLSWSSFWVGLVVGILIAELGYLVLEMVWM